MDGLRIERRGDFALFLLDKPHGNSLDEPLLASLLEACASVEKDRSVRGVVIASGRPRIFSPGFDLVTLLRYDRPAMARFVRLFGQVLASLYGLSRPVGAAVTGHAVAGGCLLAQCADVRLLAKGAMIGLNGLRAGVPLPRPAAVLLASRVAPAALTRVLLLGENLRDQDALRAGLCDEVCEPTALEEQALARIAELAAKEPATLALNRRFAHAPTVEAMLRETDASVELFLDVWFSPETQTRIRAVVESLGRAAELPRAS